MDTTDHGHVPTTGWARFVPELLVDDLDASLAFWRDTLGFECAYRRPAERFVYLERPDGAQIMLSEHVVQRGRNETAALEHPFGRGVMFQLVVDDLEPVIRAVARRGITVWEAPHEERRRTGDVVGGRREIKLLDPDGYLVMVAQNLDDLPDRKRSDP